jgi:hypothetical protein
MKIISHTPGPWRASCDDETIEEANSIYAGGICIASVDADTDIRKRNLAGKVEGPGSSAAADAMDEVDANARLIAAAPDLYDACRAMLVHDFFSIPIPDLNQMRRAVAKAEGRS